VAYAHGERDTRASGSLHASLRVRCWASLILEGRKEARGQGLVWRFGVYPIFFVLFDRHALTPLTKVM
jgi:hypothetical protein